MLAATYDLFQREWYPPMRPVSLHMCTSAVGMCARLANLGGVAGWGRSLVFVRFNSEPYMDASTCTFLWYSSQAAYSISYVGLPMDQNVRRNTSIVASLSSP